MSVKLSGRMSALAALVTPGYRLADVGCDHGYIPIFLCRTGRIPSAVAMDINQGPLEKAEKNIAAYGLHNRIQTRISDGLQALEENEADTVLIAGMGGYLVTRILTEEGAIPESVVELILQPQSDIAKVRRCVRELGFFIADEDMVEEDGKFYPMMKARRTAADCCSEREEQRAGSDCFPEKEEQRAGSDRSPEREGQFVDGDHSPERKGRFADAEVINRQDMEDLFGPVLLEKRHPVLKRWLEKELCITEAILSRLDAELSGTDHGTEPFLTREPRGELSERLYGRGQPGEGCPERSPGAEFSELRDVNPRVRSRKQELLGKERLLQEALRRYSEYSRIKC